MNKPTSPENANALKHIFGRDLLKRISTSFKEIYPSFDHKSFLNLATELKHLEMKPRVQVIRDELHRQLPEDYPKALKILLKSAQSKLLQSFDLWPYTEFVQTYGLDHPDISLEALKDLTKLFTSEWAIRPFIKLHPKKTMRFLEQCAEDKHVSVRRWASEGSRPRLPWGERLQGFVQDPEPTLTILEKLKFDPELFVRKSVANHLNDISKDHPDYVIQVLERWKKEATENDISKIEWIIKHSLRTLIKSGYTDALKLIDVSKAKIEIDTFKLKQKTISVGERLDFEINLRSTSTKNQKLVIDYIVHFVKANKSTAPKVFKLKTVQLPGKGLLKIEKSHHFKKVTTREYYGGVHTLEIQVNGVVAEGRKWVLEI